MNRQPVVALIGATAVGKTALSISIAENLRAEIISVDSRQVYRYMDVGTDKVSLSLRHEIPHHMIDIADPDEKFTVSDFAEKTSQAVSRIFLRGKIPLFVGGTPFYYNALFHASLNAELPSDESVREKYETLANSQGAELLHMRLAEIDPASAERLHKNDVKRVTRALEIFDLTGKAPSEIFENGEKRDYGFDVLYIGLSRSREELFSRISIRLEQEFSSGFVEEVEWLMKNGFDERFNPLKGLGYREILEYLRGKITLDEALEDSIARTKAFCRRQQTWFKKFSPAVWFDMSESNHEEEIIELIKKHLSGEEISQ
ncbi:MAG: tRNA (adenosine(37)-N6)-dimethylallyltransferase MiaA [Synergistales bacterium]|nr:tRNA (adenosine(37)-N6)-dimethylallyltransferase MiaA [Synergistales bacterium]MDY6401154.1 tRNA (adenosine(37)-N6)-dimethylallyltransferase MiaA [Synergistales bacterium]MDY6404747.1 tRNA (adenosine(37)-N6)-dimethylallyltransferase MiaA [Synergistales bacterium]MDY6409953.1 tRNA (adenosine(37)-N6)-dimethylallyltransferase MiaA [Synergistales bacterium]MDY6414505.1 tRNA (adenosine(37)-N6)-dimethylallyltransferase MiaA [Synergistales bacterium]